MGNREIKNSILFSLNIGQIQTFQIEELLRMKGVPSFEIEGLKHEIEEAYKKGRPCY